MNTGIYSNNKCGIRDRFIIILSFISRIWRTITSGNIFIATIYLVYKMFVVYK